MSFVTTQPEALTAAAGSLQGIGSAMSGPECGCGGPDHRGGSRRCR